MTNGCLSGDWEITRGRVSTPVPSLLAKHTCRRALLLHQCVSMYVDTLVSSVVKVRSARCCQHICLLSVVGGQERRVRDQCAAQYAWAWASARLTSWRCCVLDVHVHSLRCVASSMVEHSICGVGAAEVLADGERRSQPKCAAFSQLQNLRKVPTRYQETVDEGIAHLRFVMRMYTFQLARHWVFLHEQPWTAWSWALDFVKEVRSTKGVAVRYGDQRPLCCGSSPRWRSFATT